MEKHFIAKYRDSIIIFEIPGVDYVTKKFILNPLDGSRSTSTTNQYMQQSVLGWKWIRWSLKALAWIVLQTDHCNYNIIYKSNPIYCAVLCLEHGTNVLNKIVK